jgi:MiaB-like tRNA modifying enzyme
LGKIVVVAGCMPNIRKDELKGKNLYLLGTKNITDLPKLLRSLKDHLTSKCEVKISTEKIPKNKVIGITQLSEGCLGNCTYCATKLAKSNLYSFPQQDILESIRNDLKNGCKEIWITSQDNSAYGFDRPNPKPELPDLLKKIIALPGDFFVRIGMMNPNHLLMFKDEMIEIFKNKKVYKFLHIPVQSGSNKILKEMNRFYSKEDFLGLVNDFRKQVKDITISTDIIVGFPGETEKDFKETLDLLIKTKPEVLNLSRYWPMKGTGASKLNQVPTEIAKKRAAATQKTFKDSIDNSKWLGWSGKALVTEKTKQGFCARNEFYKRILIKTKKNILGKFVNVKIVGTNRNYLIADLDN